MPLKLAENDNISAHFTLQIQSVPRQNEFIFVLKPTQSFLLFLAISDSKQSFAMKCEKPCLTNGWEEFPFFKQNWKLCLGQG